jgi:RNA polymerase sigma-70 factor (ECF subfamily)
LGKSRVSELNGISMDKPGVDLTIVKRVQAGDDAAFNLLVRKYQHKVANLVSRYVYDSGYIEDITQEVFIKAYRAIGGFRGDSAFYTWLYRIAINTAKNYLVAQSRRPPNTDVEPQDAELTEAGRNLRDISTPESNLLTQELADRVANSVRELPEELKMAITLRELEGLSYEEIAAVMDCPIGTVRSRIFRAREAIDQQLAPLLT